MQKDSEAVSRRPRHRGDHVLNFIPCEDLKLPVLHGLCDVVLNWESRIFVIVPGELGDGVDVVGLAVLNVVIVEGLRELVAPADLGRKAQLSSF